MTIYAVVFFFLIGEMALAILLLLPLPFAARKQVFKFFSHAQAMRTGAIVVAIILAAFFYIDMKESWKYYEKMHHDEKHTHLNPTHLQEQYYASTQYFRSQRNMYMSGFALFMLVILGRIIAVVSEILKYQDNAKVMESQAKGVQREYLASGFVLLMDTLTIRYERLSKENETLKKGSDGVKEKVEAADRAIVSESQLKKQAERTQEAYMKLLEEKEGLQKQIERLRDQLTQKNVSAKKDD